MQTAESGYAGSGRGSNGHGAAIELPELCYVLQTEARLTEPRADSDDFPWIVAATAASMKHHPLPADGLSARAALLATERRHVEGLSSWVAVVGPGALEVLEELGARIDATGARRLIESAALAPHSFRPFLAQDGRGCSLVLLEHGRDLVTQWNLALVQDPEEMLTIQGLKAAADAVEARLARTGLSSRRWEIRGNHLVCLMDSPGRRVAGRPKPAKDERVRAEAKGGLLAAPLLSRAAAVHRVLFGEGPLGWQDAVRTAATQLRADGALSYKRLQANGELYNMLRDSIRFGIAHELFDEPRRGSVRAILTDASDLTTEAVDRWALRALSGLGPLTGVELARHIARTSEAILGRRMVGDRRGTTEAALARAIERLIERGDLQRRGNLVAQSP